MANFRRYLATALVSAVIGFGGGVGVYKVFDDHPRSPDTELEDKPVIVADLNRDGVPDVLSRDKYGNFIVTFGEIPIHHANRKITEEEQGRYEFNRGCVRGNLERVGFTGDLNSVGVLY